MGIYLICGAGIVWLIVLAMSMCIVSGRLSRCEDEREQTRWIPVEERLPEEENHAPGAAATSIDVIAINKYGSPIIAYCILQDSATDKKGEWFSTHNDTLISDGVYFWTYKPPEVKND